MKGVGYSKRFLAFLLDVAVVEFIITKPLNKIVGDSFSGELGFSSFSELAAGSGKLIFVSLVMGLLWVMYWAVLEYKIGQTLGGLVFKLRAKSEKGSLSFGRAFIRNLSKLSIMLLLIDSINMFFTEKRQRFLEVYSRTMTVEGGER